LHGNRFVEGRDAEDALKEMDGTELDGRVLTVQKAQGPRKTPGEMRHKSDDSKPSRSRQAHKHKQTCWHQHPLLHDTISIHCDT
jgi:RNA recognition motif-containing protein